MQPERLTARSFLTSLLAPPRCAICGGMCDWRATLCERCLAALAAARPVSLPPPPGVDRCWAAGAYDQLNRRLVAALKFRHLLPVAEVIAGAIAGGAPPGMLEGHLVPVPAAPARRRRRGFDPTREITRELACLTAAPVAHCLGRADGPRQVGRPRSARRSDPPHVWLTRSPPASAVLVDDVMTTGATLSACAIALRAGGSKRVVAVTLAITIRESSNPSVREFGDWPKGA